MEKWYRFDTVRITVGFDVLYDVDDASETEIVIIYWKKKTKTYYTHNHYKIITKKSLYMLYVLTHK